MLHGACTCSTGFWDGLLAKELGGSFLTMGRSSNKIGTYHSIKRLYDVCISSVLLVLLLPVMTVIAVAILLTMGSPVIFTQTRAGYKGRPFEVKKFRSMHSPASTDGGKVSDGQRITPLGRFLRKTSLDELPQLWNVLCGEMSLVGPRPLYVEYLDYYTARESIRHNVRPGITGLAQVSGRNFLPWDERLELDVQYVENMSFGNDLRILVKTALKVISGADVTVVPGQARKLLSDERESSRQGTNDH